MIEKLWRPIVVAAIGALIGIVSWGMVSIANVPKEYVPKRELEIHEKQNREDFKEIQQTIKDNQKEINKKVDKLIDHLIK